jgi:phage terminase Nu1 subunit (DNA packaging protein)
MAKSDIHNVTRLCLTVCETLTHEYPELQHRVIDFFKDLIAEQGTKQILREAGPAESAQDQEIISDLHAILAMRNEHGHSG